MIFDIKQGMPGEVIFKEVIEGDARAIVEIMSDGFPENHHIGCHYEYDNCIIFNDFFNKG